MTILESIKKSKNKNSPAAENLKNSETPQNNNNNNNYSNNYSNKGSETNNKETENNNNNLISSVMSDRYITPDYLAPLPPTSGEKLGKSPLQLLAQTCSQIGADTGSNKLLAEKSNQSNQNNDSNYKSNNNNNNINHKSNSRSPSLIVSDPKPVSFKPYEKSSDHKSQKAGSVVSLSPSGSRHSTNSTSPKINGNGNTKTPSPSSTATKDRSASVGLTTPAATTSSSSSSSSSDSATPVIRSGMEVLAGQHSKDPLAAFRLHSAAAGLDASNPAFGNPFGGMTGYPPTSLAASLASSVCRDPYCRDPTCPTAIYNAQMQAALTGLPPGYAELLQAQKLGFGLPGMTPPTTSSGGSAAASSAGAGPYICNWMNGRDGYCGKRHNSAEELLQHLRTHTNLSTSDSAALLSPSLYPSSLLGGAGGSSAALAAAAAGLHRSYAGLSANRFHPYAKPGGLGSALPPSLSGLGGLGGLGGLPPSLAGLGAGAYSPSSLYALYGSRFANGSLP